MSSEASTQPPEASSGLRAALVVFVIIATIAGAAWWFQRPGDDPRLEDARQLDESGQVGAAAELFADAARGNLEDRSVRQARASLLEFVGELPTMTAGSALQVLQALARTHEWEPYPDVGPQLIEPVLEQAQKRRGEDLHWALEAVRGLEEFDTELERLVAFREELLEERVAAAPDDVSAVIALAQIHEARGDLNRAIQLLEPHGERLTGNGARILGQARVAQGDFEGAYPLLKSYTDENLEQLRLAEQVYDSAAEQAWNDEIKLLDGGDGPQSFYKSYETANTRQREELVSAHVNARMAENRRLQILREELLARSEVVPVALDLGLVQLRRAQQMADESARSAELQAAEQTFLSVRGFAGESDLYRLFLGQVYAWLDKQEEAQQLFDSLLESYDRSPEILIAVGNALRELGREQEYRAYCEEAYAKAPDATQKHAAAAARALSWKDLDDRIEWLGKADLKDPSTRASLASAEGERALSHGDRTLAAQKLEEALEIYESALSEAPESPANLNNIALVHVSLFVATGKREYYTKSTELLERALQMAPSDSILLQNTAEAVLLDGTLSLFGDDLDYRHLPNPPDLNSADFFVDDPESRNQMRERIRRHDRLQQAQAYLERASIVAPQSVSVYSSQASYALAREDTRLLEALLSTLERGVADVSAAKQRSLRLYAGTEDEKHRERIQSFLERSHIQLEGARKVGGATFALAACQIAEATAGSVALGLPVDAAANVQMVREAHEAKPSLGTRTALAHALLLQADVALAEQDARYRSLRDQSRRGLTPGTRVALILCLDETLRPVILASPAVQEARESFAALGRRFPQLRGRTDWALHRYVDTAAAEQVQRALDSRSAASLALEIRALLAPLSATNASHRYLELARKGREAEGLKLLRSLEEQGVPLPLTLK